MKLLLKLAFSIIAIALLALGVILSVTWTSNVQTLDTLAKNQLYDLGFNIMNKTDRYLFERIGDLKEIAADPVITSRASTPEQIVKRLRTIRDVRGAYISLSVFDLDRVRIADTDGLDLGKQDFPHKYWQDVLPGRLSSASYIEFSRSQRVPVIYFASPVKDRNNRPFRVVVTRMLIKKLKEIAIEPDFIPSVEENMSIGLLNADGLLIYSNYNPKGILKDKFPEWETIQKLPDEKFGVLTSHHRHPSDEKSIMVFCREQGYLDFKGNGWMLLINIPTRIVFAPLTVLRNKWILVTIPTVLMAIAFVLIYAIWFSRPLNALKEAVVLFGKGNLDTRVRIKSKDEIGDLGKVFNLMAVNLQATTTSIDSLEREIAERKQIENALSASEEKYRAIVENAADQIFVLDRKMKYISANRTLGLILGKSASEMVGKSLHEFYQKETADRFSVNIDEVFKSGKNISLEEKMAAGGREFWINTQLNAIKDKAGEVSAVMGIVRDITDRKLDENTHKELFLQNKAILESAGEGIYGLDLEGRTTFINPAVTEMTGYGLEELIGKLHHSMVHHTRTDNSPYPRDECPIYLGLHTGETHHVDDDVFWKKDGTSFPVEYTSTPVWKDGSVTGAVVTFKDITERKKMETALIHYSEDLENKVKERTSELEMRTRVAEEAKLIADAANRAKSDFLSNMSHELRTPLNAILGFSDLMVKGMTGALSPKQLEFLKDIHESGTRLLTMISAMLDISRMDAGKMELKYKEVEVKNLIDWGLLIFREKTMKHGIQLGAQIEEEMVTFLADEEKIKLVMVNLLDNAVKFTPDGGSVSVKAIFVGAGLVPAHVREGQPQELPLQGGDFIEISVANTGPGIKAGDIPMLFKPFVQLDSSYEKKHQGAGLGLALCKKIVELHSGTIRAESEVGKETVFTLVIPVKPPEEEKT